VARRTINLKLSKDSHEAFKQAVQFVFDNTEKGSKEILSKAGMAYAVAGRKVTPKARKNKKREVRLVSKGRNKMGTYKVLIMKQNGKHEWVEFQATGGIQKAKKEPITSVPNIGSGKRSWNGMMRSIGSMEAIGLSNGTKVSDARFLNKQALQLVNKLSYIYKVTKNLNNIARMKAAQQMVISTEAVMERSAKAFNR
jgi:transketolase N-terminal domain/subunit